MGRIALLIALGGCDVVFGIAKVPDATPPTPEAPDPLTVTGTYALHFLHNDGNGMPVPANELPNSSQMTFTATLDDDTTRTVTLDNAGNFTFTRDRSDQGYIFDVRSPPYADIEYQLSLAQLQIAERFAGRGDRTLVPAPTSLAIHVSGRPTPGGIQSDQLQTSGVWSLSGITNTNNMDFNLDWTTIAVPNGPMGLLDSGSYDDAWYAFFHDSGPYIQLQAWARKPRVTISGGTNMIDFGAVTAPPNYPLCSHVKVDLHDEAARVTAANGGSAAGYYTGIANVPNPEFADLAQFPLAFLGTFSPVPLTSVPDLDQSFNYATYPYPGADLRALVSVTSVTALPIIAVSTYARVTNSCTATTKIDVNAIALANNVTLAGVPLVTNDLDVTVPQHTRVRIAWDAGPERADYWVVSVMHVVPAVPMPKVVEVVRMITLAHEVQLDSGKLVTNQTYRIQVEAVSGFASAVTGDFASYSPDTFVHSTVVPGTIHVTLQ